MPTVVNIPVEDITVKIATYTKIEVERATSPSGSFSEVGEITLVAGTYYYSFDDSSGTANSWYKYRFSDAAEAVRSDYSPPFQVEGTTRVKIRQGFQSQQGVLGLLSLGFVVTDNNDVAGQESTQFDSNHRNILNSLLPTDYLRGAIAYLVTSGHTARYQWGYVSAHKQVSPNITITPAFSAAIGNNGLIEMYRTADPDMINGAIVDAFRRIYLPERRPIAGDGSTQEWSLAGLVGLTSRDQLANVYYRASSSIKFDTPYKVGGRRLDLVGDGSALSLSTDSPPPTGSTLFLEYARPATPLWDDDTISPVALDLVSLLTVDEVLKRLSKSSLGAAEDRRAWEERRLEPTFQLEVSRLLKRDEPQLNWDMSLQGRDAGRAFVGKGAHRRDSVDFTVGKW